MQLQPRTIATPATDVEFLASRHITTKAVTLDADTVEADENGDKILRAGTVLGKITASGLHGPYGGRSNEVQQFDLGQASAGTFTISFDGETTAAIAYNATAAAVRAALEALSNIDPGDVTVTGGPLPGTAVVIAFGGRHAGKDVPEITINAAGLTDPTVTIATTTAGGSAASDGRETADCILLNTINIRYGNAAAAAVTHGVVYEVRLTGLDAAAKTQLARIEFR
ncbi:MAG: hypothetical protein RDU89_06985 [bacterium]|nr:hypothetical protein [bacterium]